MRKQRGDRDRREEHEVRLYHVHRLDAKRQLIPPLLFFLAIMIIIVISCVKHNRNVEAGKADMTQNAIVVDYLTTAIGAPVNRNTDEIDNSYGNYFYIGADFYEIGRGTSMALFDREGMVVFSGQDYVSSLVWKNNRADVTGTEAAAMAEELTAVYGPYEQTPEGLYQWQASEEKPLGQNKDLESVTLELNADGILVVTAAGSR